MSMDPVKAEFWRLTRRYLNPDDETTYLNDMLAYMQTMPEYSRWLEGALCRRINKAFSTVNGDVDAPQT